MSVVIYMSLSKLLPFSILQILNLSAMNYRSKRSEVVSKAIAKNLCMEDYVENILTENLSIKSKLDSKCEALTILTKEVSQLKHERDFLKEVVTDLKIKEAKLGVCSEPEIPSSDTRVLRLEIDSLRQKLRDALGDVQVLRCKLIQNKSDEETSESTARQREEDLVEQLEKVQRAKVQLQADFQSVLDEKEELVTERDAYKCKLHRLNHECNILLKGNGNGIIDLDALVMENRFLQERLIQAQEESQLAKQVADRYKNMLQAKRQKGFLKSSGGGSDSNSGMLLSQKQVKELLENCGRTDVPGPETSFSDLRALCLALLDGLGDKTLALTHQKRANRILAARISELQSRLESLQSKQALVSPSNVLLEGYRTASDIFESSSSSPDISHSEGNDKLHDGGLPSE